MVESKNALDWDDVVLPAPCCSLNMQDKQEREDKAWLA